MGAADAAGKAAVLALAAAGADVFVTGVSTEAEEALAVRRTSRAVVALGRQSRDSMIDLAIGTHVQVGVRQLAKEFGPPDICVVAADYFLAKDADRTTDVDWARVHNLCVASIFYAFRAVAREMASVEREGHAVRGHLIALIGTKPEGGAIYRASKGAAAALVAELAADWQYNGIFVNAVKFDDDGDEATYRWVGEAVVSLCQ
jgi:NAD(P)-dependent dehydrogenase (short-subunit alcohol dehydrogenase family)